MSAILRSPIIAPLAALLLVTAAAALSTPRFIDPGNLSNLALQVSIVAIVAIGSTFVILIAAYITRALWLGLFMPRRGGRSSPRR